MNVLCAGGSAVGGPANYLLGILRSLRVRVRHLSPTARLASHHVRENDNAIIRSDFPSRQAPLAVQQRILDQVRRGAGLFIVGGWASFGAGGWRGSIVEELLLVGCRSTDDRLNLPSGALLAVERRHPLLPPTQAFQRPPLVCGLNTVDVKPSGLVLLRARPLLGRPAATLRAAAPGYPLLVISPDPRRRSAALIADLATHWCGGLVDWGAGRRRLPVHGRLSVEVGVEYIRFVRGLLQWLAGPSA